MPIHPETQRRITAYLAEAGHGSDLEGPLFRPVKNNTSKKLRKPLNPHSIHREIVLRYAKQIGRTERSCTGFAYTVCVRRRPPTRSNMGRISQKCRSGWGTPTTAPHGCMINGDGGRRRTQPFACCIERIHFIQESTAAACLLFVHTQDKRKALQTALTQT